MTKTTTPSKQKIIPLAYFITFTCYGTWLHGAKENYVDRKNNIFQTNFLSLNSAREMSIKRRMREEPYVLDLTQRSIVLNTIKEVCNHKEWNLFAAHIRTNHVHLVLSAPKNPEFVMNTIKAYASRRLNEANLDNIKNRRWTKHGSTRYLWKEEDILATINYVIYEQGKAMDVFQNENIILGT